MILRVEKKTPQKHQPKLHPFFWGGVPTLGFYRLGGCFFEKKIVPKFHYKVGPLPVISRVITPLIGVITPVTHL